MIIAQAALAASSHRANKLFYSTPNSMEKKRLQLATKQGKRGITAESVSAAQPPATTALLEPGLKCQERTMRYDKLLSSNSCTANFQLYTQMALRLEENGVHGENGSRFLCLFGGDSAGGRVTSLPKEASACEIHVQIPVDELSNIVSYKAHFSHCLAMAGNSSLHVPLWCFRSLHDLLGSIMVFGSTGLVGFYKT